MKKIITVTLLLVSLNAISQQKKLIDYFFSEQYDRKEYKWNSAGVLEYELTKVDNNLFVSSSIKQLPNGTRMSEINYFHPYANKIVHTVQKTSFTNGFKRLNKTIIQYPKSNWSVESDRYSSYLTSTKTTYKEYKDCIAVRIKTKDFGGGSSINYYAYGIGLVKKEVFDAKRKLVIKKELIDTTETPTVHEIFIKNKVKELRLKTYSYQKFDTTQYQFFVDKYTDKVVSRFKGYARSQLKTRRSYWKYQFKPTEVILQSPAITYEKLYNRVYSDVVSSVRNISSNELNRLLSRVYIDEKEFPMVCFDFEGEPDCYEVSTTIKIKDFEIQLAKGVTIIKKSSKGKVKFLEKNLRKDIEEKITTLLSSTKKGKYLLSYLVGTVNKKDVSEIAVEKM